MPNQMGMDKDKWLTVMRAGLANTALENLAIQIVDVSEDGIQLRMPITPKTHQPMGLLHGGVTMVLVESAASLHACWGMDLNVIVPVGIEINASHLNSASEGWAHASAKVLRRARRIIVHEVEVMHEETLAMLSVARVTNYYKRVVHTA